MKTLSIDLQVSETETFVLTEKKKKKSLRERYALGVN